MEVLLPLPRGIVGEIRKLGTGWRKQGDELWSGDMSHDGSLSAEQESMLSRF